MNDLSTTLNTIFRDNHGYLARWDTAYANHLSMAAAALFLMSDRCAIPAEKLERDAAIYQGYLSPLRRNTAATLNTQRPATTRLPPRGW